MYDNPLPCLFAICTCLTFKLAIFFKFTFDTTTSLLHPTPAKLTLDGITAYSRSANSIKKLAFFSNLSINLQQFKIALSSHSSGINPFYNLIY